jgi:SAM-dependent methyltransferase
MTQSKKPEVTQRRSCSACGSRSLEEAIDLPNLPLTGIFVLPEERSDYTDFDQGLMRCTECGHGQLRESISPTYLYQDTYTHRSSLSPISRNGNDFFLQYVQDTIGERNFDCIAEVGCNDLYLLRKLANRGKTLVGFDPIWKDRAPDPGEAISVHGKYIEEIDPAGDLPERPDLVLSVNTLEHVDDPLESLRPIYEHAKPGAIFMVEVPSLDTLLLTGRFDQIFHQHLNYFSVPSMRRMIEMLGGEYLSHCYNYKYWLGTFLFAFRKPEKSGASGAVQPVPPPVGREAILAGYASHQRAMSSLGESLRRLIQSGTPAIGFGAAQMVPVLAYHMQSDFGELRFILDDNPDKKGRTYPSISTLIDYAPDYKSLDQYAVLITALDSARPILQRLTSLSARYILNANNPL